MRLVKRTKSIGRKHPPTQSRSCVIALSRERFDQPFAVENVRDALDGRDEEHRA
jgi:hypothetical protein